MVFFFSASPLCQVNEVMKFDEAFDMAYRRAVQRRSLS